MTDAGSLPICCSNNRNKVINERGGKPLSFYVEEEKDESKPPSAINKSENTSAQRYLMKMIMKRRMKERGS